MIKLFSKIKGFFIRTQEDMRMLKIQEITNEINSLFLNLTVLMNTPEFNRFDVFDYYTKKTQLHSVIALINSISIRYKTNLVEKSIIVEYLTEIKNNTENYDKILMVLHECISKSLNNHKIFIVLRNTIAQEWIRRNILESKFKPKDLNVLNYSFEDYLKHLEACKYLIIYDIEKFINRYGQGHSKYIEVETDIRKSINTLIYKEVEFSKIDKKLKELEKLNFNLFKKKPKPITLRGWFKNNTIKDLGIFNVLSYKPYEKSL